MAGAILAIGASVAGSLSGPAIATAIGFAGSAIAGKIAGAVVTFGIQSLGSKLLGGDGREGADLFDQQARGLLVNTSSTVAPIPVIYGFRRVGGIRVFGPEVTGSAATNTTGSETLHQAIVLSEGTIENVDTIYFDDLDWQSAHFRGVSGDLQSLATWERGSDTQAANGLMLASLPNLWSTAHRLQGTAYVYARATWDQSQGAEDIWNGVPTVTADVKGVRCTDPRTGALVFSQNPAVIIRDYLTNTRYGRGIPTAALDDDSFIDAANYCEQSVSTPVGGTVRYACNGVVDTSQTTLTNLAALLSSCRGVLVWTGGKYRLVIDKEETASFAFTEDNIVGAWSISLGDKRQRFNRVRARWFNPARQWQPDIAVVDSAEFRAADNGTLLETEIALPFTTDPYMAQRIAIQELKASRQSITVSFRATLEALQAEVGDVVTVTHSSPGWSAKTFRVHRVALTAEGEVEVTLREYDATVYDVSNVSAVDAAPDTNLPNPFNVAAPGAPAISEELYETRGSAGVKSRAVVSWSAGGAQVVEYQVEYRLASASTYTIAGRTPALQIVINDLAPGEYVFRVKGRTSIGTFSAYSPVTPSEIIGLLGAPTVPANLTISAVGGLAILRWDRSPDLDVRIGGKVVFRHSNDQSGAAWGASVSIGNAVSGDQTVAVLPLKPGTYLAKAVDSSGVYSSTAATAVTKGAQVLTFSNVGTVSEHTTFTGTKTSTVASGGVLKLDSNGDVDSWTDWDTVADVDAEGGIIMSGTYDFSAGIDLTTVKLARLIVTIGATVTNAKDQVDDRGENIDDWEDFDGSAAGDVADAQVWVRETNDDPAASPTWSDWQRLDVAEFNARAFEFQARLSTTDAAYNIEIDELTVDAEEVV